MKSIVTIRSTVNGGLTTAVGECMDKYHWGDIVPRDATVVIKPNLCTAVPDKVEMSNTDPNLTAAVCEVLLTRSNRIHIAESDNLRQKAQDAFAVSGYLDIEKRLGVKLVNLSQLPRTRIFCEPAGEVELPRLLLEADVFITLPVLKTHALTYFTGALKNQWGCLPQYNRILFHKHLDPMIVSLNRILNPKLIIMDGIVGAEGRGPVSGKPRRLDLIVAGADPVAIDATAMRLVSLEPTRSRHLVLAAGQGLGRMEKELISIDGDWERHATQFEPAILDKAIAAMNYMSRYPWFVRHFLERDYIFYPVRSAVQFLRRIGVVEGG